MYQNILHDNGIITVCMQFELNLDCLKICYHQSFDRRAAWMCDVAADCFAPAEFKQAKHATSYISQMI
jgi:hypothetical protein